MNELHFAYKIRQQLNSGLPKVSPDISARLAKARELALIRQKQSVSQPVLAAINGFIDFKLDLSWSRQMLAATLLLLAIAGSMFWVADRRVNELGAIDSALLSDELPVAAFADKGFGAWLKYSAQE